MNRQAEPLHQQRSNHLHDFRLARRVVRDGDVVESIAVDPIWTTY
jgi:hypothetical protein